MKNEIGNIYSRLKVIEKGKSDNGVFWICQCSCGKKKEVNGSLLRRGIIKSCGCLWKEQIKKNYTSGRQKKSHNFPHGRKLKDLYNNMIKRCYDKENKRYNCYGGRGIYVCKEWRENRREFYRWAINSGYSPHKQINRIDNNGPYSPENCNFVTQIQNMNNTQRSHMVEWNGEVKSISDWAREFGVKPQALIHRFTRNWSIERAMTQPFRGKKND